MKTLLITLGILLSGFSGEAADNGTDGDCSRLHELSSLDLRESIELDLLNSSWTIASQDQNNTYVLNFHANGLVEKFLVQGEGEEVSFLLWTTDVMSDNAWLILEDKNMKRTYLQLQQNCFGLLVENVLSGEVTSWQHESKLPAPSFALKKTQLEGRWSSAVNPFQFDEEMHGCENYEDQYDLTIEWDFQKNSLFSLKVCTEGNTQKAKGVWDLTPDGNYILLHFTESENPERHLQTVVLRIGTLSFKDLVLYQTSIEGEVDLRLCNPWRAVHYQSI